MRIYVGASIEDLRALAAGTPLTGQRFRAASEDEEDELAALEEAAEAGDVAVAVDVPGEDDPAPLDRVEAFHVDVDGSGDLAWYARQELDDVLRLF